MNKDIKLKMSVLDENGKLVEIPDFIKEHIKQIEKSWFEKMKKLDKTYKKQIQDLEAKLAESNERLKAIDSWKENYGYSNYEDVYMLEDLQSRAFQSEDDTKVVNEILDCLNISDETEILSTLKQQLAEKEKKIEEVKKSKTYIMNFGGKVKEVRVLDDNQTAIAELEKVKEFIKNEKDYQISTNAVLLKIDQQIKLLKGEK